MAAQITFSAPWTEYGGIENVPQSLNETGNPASLSRCRLPTAFRLRLLLLLLLLLLQRFYKRCMHIPGLRAPVLMRCGRQFCPCVALPPLPAVCTSTEPAIPGRQSPASEPAPSPGLYSACSWGLAPWSVGTGLLSFHGCVIHLRRARK